MAKDIALAEVAQKKVANKAIAEMQTELHSIWTRRSAV
jgi:hypothetical protein